MAVKGGDPKGIHSMLVDFIDICMWVINDHCNYLFAIMNEEQNKLTLLSPLLKAGGRCRQS
jgi:hypothetical protein